MREKLIVCPSILCFSLGVEGDELSVIEDLQIWLPYREVSCSFIDSAAVLPGSAKVS